MTALAMQRRLTLLEPVVAEAAIDPRKNWRVEFADETGMGNLTKREAMRTVRHEIRQGRRVTIVPPAAA